MSNKYVQTNMGLIPLEDYLDIQAQQYGFDDYEDLRNQGLSLVMPETIVKDDEEIEL